MNHHADSSLHDLPVWPASPAGFFYAQTSDLELFKINFLKGKTYGAPA